MISLATIAFAALTTTLSGTMADDEDPLISSTDTKTLVKSVREYYGHLDKDKPGAAFKELSGLQKKLDSIAKKSKLGAGSDLLSSTMEWRDIIREGSAPTKINKEIRFAGKFNLSPIVFDAPWPKVENPKVLQGTYNEELSVFVSVPRDAKKVAHPVIITLHPQEVESGAIKSMKKSKALKKWVQEWLKETYSSELLAGAIVVAPIMDLVVLEASGLTGTRPTWDSPNNEGASWALTALKDVVLSNLNYDPTRIYIDGYGTGATAAVKLCAQFPGVQAGAIVRGAAPDRVHFNNCKASPIHFVGPESKEFHDTWAQEKGFDLTHSDTLSDADLLQWMQDHPKQYCPDKVELFADSLSFSTAYWLRITRFDFTLETTDPAHIIGEVDRENNQITVTTNALVKGFIVYLNDSLLNLDEPIKIVHRGPASAEDEDAEPVIEVRYEGTRKRRLQDTLELAYYRAHGNIGEVFTTQIPVDL